MKVSVNRSRFASRRAHVVAWCVAVALLAALPSHISVQAGEPCARVEEGSFCVPFTSGPDVVAKLDPCHPERYGCVGNIHGFMWKTTAYNIGDDLVKGDFPGTGSDHAVVAQNMYRLTADQFMQIGMSWVKHDDWMQNTCNACDPPSKCQMSYCGPEGEPWPGPANGIVPGCSDTYGAPEMGYQPKLGPRSDINAYAGTFPAFVGLGCATGDTKLIDRRLQVHNDDLDPAQNAGAKYFIELHFVAKDDADDGNQYNNVTYAENEVVSCDPVTTCPTRAFSLFV